MRTVKNSPYAGPGSARPTTDFDACPSPAANRGSSAQQSCGTGEGEGNYDGISANARQKKGRTLSVLLTSTSSYHSTGFRRVRPSNSCARAMALLSASSRVVPVVLERAAPGETLSALAKYVCPSR